MQSIGSPVQPSYSTITGCPSQIALNIIGSQKDQSIEPRQVVPFGRCLSLEQRGKRFRLPVGEKDGVVFGVKSAVLGPGPGAGVAVDASGPRLVRPLRHAATLAKTSAQMNE
jgi:hypothetical protein